MMISVVLPAFNESATIQRCFEALEAQTLSRELFEVILVDNGSRDNTLEVAGQFLGRLPLRIASEPTPGVSGARNLGATLARGRILAFLDTDCLPPPDWLEVALRLQPANAIWGADYRVPKDATWVGRVWLQFQAREQDGHVVFLPAGSLFIERDRFLEMGGFDTAVETSEDVELCTRARRQGMRVLAFPALAVFHEGTPRTLRRFYRQNRWHGKHVLRVFLNNLPSTRNLPVVGMSAYTLLMVWGAGAGLLLAIWRRELALFLVPAILLTLPALLLALRKTLAQGQPGATPALWALYQTYFLARAASLTRGVTRGRR